MDGWPFYPFRRGVASSEAESTHSLEGRLTTLKRGGDVGRLSRVSAGSPRAMRRSPRGFEEGAGGPHCVFELWIRLF